MPRGGTVDGDTILNWAICLSVLCVGGIFILVICLDAFGTAELEQERQLEIKR